MHVTPTEVAAGETSYVRVVDGEGVPVSGAVVSLSSGERATTDQEGMAAFVTDEPGQYVLTAEKSAGEYAEFISDNAIVEVRAEDVRSEPSEPTELDGGDSDVTGTEAQTESQFWDQVRVGIERGLPTIIYEGSDT
ncbi:hypothetical protein [Halorientalis regularis]|nr:hypothetical protein [Halorientalis regularis]